MKEVYKIATLEELDAVLAEQSEQSEQPGRSLRDMYAESLVHTNMLLTQLFEYEDRKVPAHMPHFLNREVLQQIENMIGDQFTLTRQHRFRSSDDLQYAFMYFYFLKEIEKKKMDAYYDSLWDLYLDTDHDGFLNTNEFKTLAAMVYRDDVNEEFAFVDLITCRNMRALLDCLTPEEEETESFTLGHQEVTRITKKRPFITFQKYKECGAAIQNVADRFRFNTRFSQHKDNVVAFEMITDDLKETTKKVNESVMS